MKYNHIKTFVGAAIVGLMMGGCSDILDETPRATYTPEYFKTENGVIGGVTSLYAHLRYIWGNGYWLNACETGTDEYTFGHGGDQNFKVMDMSGQGDLTASSSRSDVLWNNSFSDINTASGIIENASSVSDIAASLVAEAYFFRAFDYFCLVQTFGGVPLDLGAGELKFNTSTVRTSVRNTVPEVYTKSIFPDLIKAVADLPTASRLTGTVTKNVARLFLAKAYLTYAWWLKNPNNIDTYPTCDRTDPDGKTAAQYFQLAYDTALEAIQNPTPYALQKSFYMVNVGSNDRNSEVMLYADHTQDSEYYDGSSHSYNTGASPGNFAAWMTTWDYTFLQSSLSTAWSASDLVRSVQREAAQAYGRPWKCMAPPINAIVNNFPDKTYDSRYDATFVTCFRGNWTKGNVAQKTLYNANNMPVVVGDAILTFLSEEPAETVDYSNSTYKSNVGAGVLPGRADYVVGPNEISRYKYPLLWKIGTYRTDNGTGLGQPNGGITRPFPIAKFSEFYLVAAEAAVEGATTTTGYTARDLVNVLRARAGVWTFDNAGNKEKAADYSAEVTAATPATITIDYILAERSREYYGEGLRWWDLVRTQKWTEYAASYTICGTAASDHTPKTYSRTIENYMYLRPIPQGQIDGLEMTAEEKAAYQNPGYK
jgi:hypothetical protein